MHASVVLMLILIYWVLTLLLAHVDKRFRSFEYAYSKGTTIWWSDGFSAKKHFALMYGNPVILGLVMFLIFHYHRWDWDAEFLSAWAGILFSLQFHITKPRRIEVPSALYDPGVLKTMYESGGKQVTTGPTTRGVRPAAFPQMLLMAFVAKGLLLFYGWTGMVPVYMENGHIELRGVHHWQLLLITVLLTIFIPTCIVGPDKHYYRDGKARLGAKLMLLLIPYLWFLCWYMW